MAWNDDDATISEARATLLHTPILYEGRECPCCGQFTKAYKRTITGTMAANLITAYRDFGERSFRPIDVFGKNSPDFVKLRYWELIEEMDPEAVRDDGSPRTGHWRLTYRALPFVRGVATRQKYAVIYDGKLLRHEGESISIRDCLGKKFDYNALMKGI